MPEGTEGSTRAHVYWLRFGVFASVVAALVALAPLLWTAIQAGASLFVLGAMFLVGWAILQALPYLGQLLEKRILRERMVDAQQNPIEELLSQLLLRGAQLTRYRDALVTIAAQIRCMSDMLDERRAVAPQHDTQKQVAALHKMVAFHAHHMKNLAAAELALADYKRHLAAKRFEWTFAQAGKQVLAGLRANDRESILRELLSDEASRSVQLGFERVFASLDAELQSVEKVAPELGVSLPGVRALSGELP